MKRIKLIVAYDGTNYCGWQTQINGITVEEVLNKTLSGLLKEDIRIQESCQVADDFHPRFCNTIKTYEYKILNRKFALPTERLYSAFVYYPLDVEKMQMAAAYLVGEHDFKSFCSSGSQVESTVRTITDISVEKHGEMISIRVSGNGFLYNMVRIIVGTLMKIGLGVWEPERMEEILNACDRNAAGPKAEARGLTLVEIRYL